jgi:hypothetical protein
MRRTSEVTLTLAPSPSLPSRDMGWLREWVSSLLQRFTTGCFNDSQLDGLSCRQATGRSYVHDPSSTISWSPALIPLRPDAVRRRKDFQKWTLKLFVRRNNSDARRNLNLRRTRDLALMSTGEEKFLVDTGETWVGPGGAHSSTRQRFGGLPA